MDSEGNGGDAAEVVIKFRNYRPVDEALQQREAPKPALPSSTWCGWDRVVEGGAKPRVVMCLLQSRRRWRAEWTTSWERKTMT